MTGTARVRSIKRDLEAVRDDRRELGQTIGWPAQADRAGEGGVIAVMAAGQLQEGHRVGRVAVAGPGEMGAAVLMPLGAEGRAAG